MQCHELISTLGSPMTRLFFKHALSFTLLTLTAQVQAQDAVAPGTESLPEVVVTGESVTENYAAPSTNAGAMKSDTSLLETPQAVSVITEQLMKDQFATKLEDVIRNAAGVSTGGYYEGWDYYRIRGFDASFTTFWDGLRGDNGMNAEVFGMERVEIIKGPASSLYGQGPLGGFVNAVSKRPKPEFFGEITGTVSSWNSYRSTMDIGGSLNQDKTVYGRLSVLYREGGSFVDHVEKNRFFIAPSLTWEITPDTSLTILGNFTHDWGTLGMPLPARGTVLSSPNGEISIDRFIGIPGVSNQSDQWRARLGYEFKHKFNEIFSLRQNLSFSHLEQDWDDVLYPASLSADGRTLYTYPYDYQDEKQNRFGVDTALDAVFKTGTVKHSMTFGVDYYYTQSESGNRQIDYSDFPGSYVPIDLYHPVSAAPLPAYASQGYSDASNTMLGFYFQEHAKLTDKWTLTLGGRYDTFWYADDIASTEDSQSAFTPKVGATYEFVPGASAYVNYSRSFTPQWYSTDSSGSPVSPEEGENWEAGVKYSLAEGKITGLLAVYQLTRENVATANLATADPFDSTISGEQRSQGFEFETAMELAPGLNFTTAYTYIDAEVTKDSTVPEGTPLQGVPEHAVNAWLKYTVQDGPLKGFGVGLGGRYYTSQSGDQFQTFDLPAYGLVDAALYYERKDVRVQVNFNNVLDKRHFVGSYNDLYVLPGQPFNVSASVTWKF